MTVSPSAATVSSWFIDPMNGNDSYPGTADLHGTVRALRTHEELRRRIGDQVLEGDVVVTLLNDFDGDNPIIVDFTLGANASLSYRGEKALTTLHSGTFTSVVPIDRASNQAQIVGDSSLAADWKAAGLVNSNEDLPDGSLRRIRITGGARAGAIAYACADLGGKAARTSPFGRPAGIQSPPPNLRQVVPQVGDPFVIESGFVLIDSFVVDIKISPIGTPFPPGKLQLLFTDLELNPNRVNRHHVRARAEPVFGGPGKIHFTGCGVGNLSPQYANKVTLDLCRLGGTEQTFQATLVQLGGCCCLGTVIALEGSRLVAFADTIFQGGGARLQGLARLGNVAFFETHQAPGLEVEENGTARVETVLRGVGNGPFAAGKAVYGTGQQGPGVKVRPGGCLIYEGPEPNALAAGLTVTGSTDVDVAGNPSTWAAVAPDFAVPSKRAAVAQNA